MKSFSILQQVVHTEQLGFTGLNFPLVLQNLNGDEFSSGVGVTTAPLKRRVVRHLQPPHTMLLPCPWSLMSPPVVFTPLIFGRQQAQTIVLANL
jgi:hypothetical protein